MIIQKRLTDKGFQEKKEKDDAEMKEALEKAEKEKALKVGEKTEEVTETAAVEADKKDAPGENEAKQEENAVEGNKIETPAAETGEEGAGTGPGEGTDENKPVGGDDNQLIAPDGAEKTEEEKKALADKLNSFGKPDPEIFDSYRYVVYLRALYTTNYMTERFTKKKQVEDGRSCIAKCGSLIKTLLIYGVVAAFMIPLIYELYQKLTSNGKSAIFDGLDDEIVTTKGKSDMTPEEIAQHAAEMEA